MVQKNKILLAVTLLVGTAIAQFGPNTTVNPLPHQNSGMAQQNRTITSGKTYNSLDHGGMAAGMMTTQQYPLTLNFGFGGQGLASEDDSLKISNGLFTLPMITVGTPEKVALRTYYGITPLVEVDKGKDSLTLAIPLHRVGAYLAAQSDKKLFRFGFNFDMFMGRVGYEETSDSGRVVLGADKIGISFGSSPHELISFDLGISTSGYIDSLYGTHSDTITNVKSKQERMAELVLPNAELAFNFGSVDYPVLSSFSINAARKNFVYANRDNGVTINADPIVADSVGWDWRNRIHIDIVPEKFKVNPSFELGYWHNRQKVMIPGEDNFPLSSNYDGEKAGYRWETSSFKFGFGLDFELFQFADYWVEYGRSNVKLDLTGEVYSNTTSGMAHDNAEEEFNRFATGTEIGFHNIPALGYSETGELFFTASFLHLQETGLNRSYYGSSQYEHFNELTTNTQNWKYTPWDGIKHRVRTNDIALGLRAAFMNNSIEAAAQVHFIDQMHGGMGPDLTGKRFQFSVVYNLSEK